MLNKIQKVNYLFAIIIFLGGLMGFIAKGSIISLVASLIFALLLGLTNYYIPQKKSSHYVFILITMGLIVLFFWRLFAFGAIMPALPIIVISSIVLGLNVFIPRPANE